ncbi:MAG: NfeD family protein [Oligoflexus sp.]
MSRKMWLLIGFLVVLTIGFGGLKQVFAEEPPATTETEELEDLTESSPENLEPIEVHEASNRSWLQVEIGIIGTASDDILRSSMELVQEKGYSGLIIAIDTPGGALEATRSMVKRLLASPFPIAVWVGPSGGRAGSAGAFVTLAGHVAAMAPGTNIGAAQPVQATGQDIEESDIKRKIENDTVAFMESIAKVRNRNVEMAVSFVTTSLSITAEEAVEHKVVDLLARSPIDLLKQMDGQVVKIGDQSLTLNTTDSQIFIYEKSVRELFLEILSNPNVFYLLFIAGIIGIGIELTNPGVMIPGVLGGISLIVALIATSVLPINFGAMLLILVSVAFMVAEVFLPSFGILGIGGFIAFLIGSVLLVDSGSELGLGISWWTIAPAALGVALFGGLVAYLVVRNEKSQVASGAEGLKGHRAVAFEAFEDGQGRVKMDGEYWQAKLLEPYDQTTVVKQGDVLQVVEIKGLVLIVKAIQSN